jgi:hypothetical protein
MAKWHSPCAKDMIPQPFDNILHHHQIIIYLFCAYSLTELTPWPLDNHKAATCINCYMVNTTCMSQILRLNNVLIIKSKFTNLQNIIVNMQVILSVTAIQWLATVLCYLLHLYIITSITAIQSQP